MGLISDDLNAKIVFAGMRFFIASLLLFLITKFVIKKSLKVNKKNMLNLLLLGILQTGLQYFFFYNGLSHTSGIKSAVFSSIETFFVVLFAHFIYPDDKINFRKLIGLVLGFGGIFWLI